jgi:hypothetical protein
MRPFKRRKQASESASGSTANSSPWTKHRSPPAPLEIKLLALEAVAAAEPTFRAHAAQHAVANRHLYLRAQVDPAKNANAGASSSPQR